MNNLLRSTIVLTLFIMLILPAQAILPLQVEQTKCHDAQGNEISCAKTPFVKDGQGYDNIVSGSAQTQTATMVSATSDGGNSVDTVNATTKDKLNDTNQNTGFPNVVIWDNYVSPLVAIPGSMTTLYVTISEIDGVDWAKDVTVFVDILNPDGTSFVETGTSHAERYLGRIDQASSKSTSFAINIPNSAWLGNRNIRTTVRYYETGWLDIGTTGPYYIQNDISFRVENPTIEVTSPNGGILLRGTPNTITWSSTGSTGADVKIELLNSGISVGTVTPSTPNDGSYSWTISPTRALGWIYQIRVTSISNPTISDISDNYFYIGGINVDSPNGGEILVRGTANTITWSRLGDLVTNLKIELLKNGIPVGTVTPGIPNDGSYSWTVSPTRTLGSDYKIRVTNINDPGYTDTSNNNFIIGGINVNSPNGGENWARGTPHTITWSKLGNPGPNVRIDLLKNGLVVGTVTSSTPNDGSQPWTVSLGRAPGTDYKIRVMSTSNSAYKDTSNNNFRIS